MAFKNDIEKRATNFTELSQQINGVNNRINGLIYWILGTGVAITGIIVAIKYN